MAINKNYYAILGISKHENLEGIRRAYRQKCKEWHPDRNKHPKATEMMMNINEAYHILSNPESRKNYDTLYDALFTTDLERYCSTQSDEQKVEDVRSKYQEEARRHEETVRSIKFDIRAFDQFLEEKFQQADKYIEGSFYWVGKIVLYAFGLFWLFVVLSINLPKCSHT